MFCFWIGLANQNSLELVKSLKKKFPKLNIIVMELLPIQSDIIQFIEEGVSGVHTQRRNSC